MARGRKLSDVTSATRSQVPKEPSCKLAKTMFKIKEERGKQHFCEKSGRANENWWTTEAEEMRMFVFLQSAAQVHILLVYVQPKWSPTRSPFLCLFAPGNPCWLLKLQQSWRHCCKNNMCSVKTGQITEQTFNLNLKLLFCGCFFILTQSETICHLHC